MNQPLFQLEILFKWVSVEEWALLVQPQHLLPHECVMVFQGTQVEVEGHDLFPVFVFPLSIFVLLLMLKFHQLDHSSDVVVQVSDFPVIFEDIANECECLCKLFFKCVQSEFWKLLCLHHLFKVEQIETGLNHVSEGLHCFGMDVTDGWVSDLPVLHVKLVKLLVFLN